MKSIYAKHSTQIATQYKVWTKIYGASFILRSDAVYTRLNFRLYTLLVLNKYYRLRDRLGLNEKHTH